MHRSRKALVKLAAGKAPVAAPARAMLTLPQGVHSSGIDDAHGAASEILW